LCSVLWFPAKSYNDEEDCHQRLYQRADIELRKKRFLKLTG